MAGPTLRSNHKVIFQFPFRVGWSLKYRGRIEDNQHHVLVTARAFFDVAAVLDLADLPRRGGAE